MKKLLPFALLFCSLPALAETIDSGEWTLNLTLGYGQIANPLQGRDDIALYALPTLSYYGNRFYMENTYLGYALYEQGNVYLDLVGQFNEDGYFYAFAGNRSATLKSLIVPGTNFGLNPDQSDTAETDLAVTRRLSYLAGLSLTWKTALADIRFNSLTDISAGYHGTEHHLSLSRDFSWDKLKLRLQGRYIQQSAATTNYYYNFTDSELTTLSRPFAAMHLGTSRHYQLQLVVVYTVTEQLDAIAYIKHHQLDKTLAISPLLKATQSTSHFMGLRYRF